MGLFRCCMTPESDPTGRLPRQLLQGLPEFLAMLVLADANHRLHRSAPNVLEQTHYSRNPDEARTQVLVRWIEILGTTTEFATRFNAAGFAELWDSWSTAMLPGMTDGFLRASDEELFVKARRLAEAIPAHQMPLLHYFIQRTEEANFGRDLPVEQQDPTYRAMPAGVAQRRTSVSQYPDGVEFLNDGRAVLHFPPDADFAMALRQAARIARRLLRAKEMSLASEWVTQVTRIPIRNGVWQQEHDDVFAHGFIRFLWDGGTPSEEMREHFAKMKGWLRGTYPILAGSPIDIELDGNIRLVYSKLTNWTPDLLRDISQERTGPLGTQLPELAGRSQGISAVMIERGCYYKQNNFRSINDWEKRMVTEFGCRVVEFLPEIWNTVTGRRG